MDTLNHILGEAYWNWADWLPWIAAQVVFALVVALVIQWWFKRGLVAFLAILILSFPMTFRSLPAPALSAVDLVRLNAKLPQTQDGVTLERISFSHRFLTYHFSLSAMPDEAFLKSMRDIGRSEACNTFLPRLEARQVKRVVNSYSYPGGETTQHFTLEDCKT